MAKFLSTGHFMRIINWRNPASKFFYRAFALLPLLGLFACQTAASRRAELKKQGEEAVSAADLRAFCPPVEFTDSGYAYTLYAGRRIAWQAALTDITRDCRYDHDKGLIYLHIAAAGRVVNAAGGGRAALSLPIAIKIARGDQVLFSHLYQQQVKAGQANAAAQFLFSGQAAVKTAEAVKGTKIFIGFTPSPRPAAAPDSRPGALKPRLTPKAGDIIIPESF